MTSTPDVLGAWYDGSGAYSAVRTGDILTVDYGNGTTVTESFTYTLTRTPDDDTVDRSDFVLDSAGRIAIDSDPVAGTDFVGRAWVDGLAYGMSDVVTVIDPLDNVRTWADGFGRWHAVVPDTSRGLTNALEAMARELMERAPKGQTLRDMMTYLNANVVSLPSTQPGTVHFAEYATPVV